MRASAPLVCPVCQQLVKVRCHVLSWRVRVVFVFVFVFVMCCAVFWCVVVVGCCV